MIPAGGRQDHYDQALSCANGLIAEGSTFQCRTMPRHKTLQERVAKAQALLEAREAAKFDHWLVHLKGLRHGSHMAVCAACGAPSLARTENGIRRVFCGWGCDKAANEPAKT